MKLSGLFKKDKIVDWLAIVATFIFILAGILVSLNRFWQYDTFYYNFGVFDEAIWHVSRLQPPIIEHLLVGGKWLFADHFDISVLLLAPVFWLTSRSEVLLVVQAVFAGLAGFVIYRIGVEVLKNKILALSIVCGYFLFIGIQNAVITDFQELTVMTLPTTLTFLAIIKKQVKLFWLFFLITLGFKEVTFLLGIGIAIFLFFYNRKWTKQAFIAAFISVVWGLVTIKLLIPYFSGGGYLHWPAFSNGIIGKAYALIDHPIKRQTLFFSFLQFGFLPIFAPVMWFAIMQDYILRFLPEYDTTYWGLGLHYNAVVSTLLSIGSIFGLSFLLRFKIFDKIKYPIALLLVLNAFFLFRFVWHGPFLLALNPVFYQDTKDFKFLNQLIAKIPKNASIMTQNNLGVRFDHQKFIYMRMNYEAYKPDYILIDDRSGQNPNDFLFVPSVPLFLRTLSVDKNYKLYYHIGAEYIYKRK